MYYFLFDKKEENTYRKQKFLYLEEPLYEFPNEEKEDEERGVITIDLNSDEMDVETNNY